MGGGQRHNLHPGPIRTIAFGQTTCPKQGQRLSSRRNVELTETPYQRTCWWRLSTDTMPCCGREGFARLRSQGGRGGGGGAGEREREWELEWGAGAVVGVGMGAGGDLGDETRRVDRCGEVGDEEVHEGVEVDEVKAKLSREEGVS